MILFTIGNKNNPINNSPVCYDNNNYYIIGKNLFINKIKYTDDNFEGVIIENHNSTFFWAPIDISKLVQY